VGRAAVEIGEEGQQPRREILVEQQPHARGIVTSLRSRSAGAPRTR
jgi:hypothetical protein